MTTDLLGRIIVAAYLAGAASALTAPRAAVRTLASAAGVVGAVASLVLGVLVLGGAAGPAFTIDAFALAPVMFRLDPLGAFFLLVVGGVGLAAAWYGFGYLGGAPAAVRRGAGAGLNVLLLTLSLQVMADNPLTFLIVWELMSLAACALVLLEPDQPGALSAANWYLGVTHAGFAALVAMFLLLAGGNLGTSFGALRTLPLAAGARDAVFVLALVGFGAKAGIVPLHVWLPRAHPVAPSHGSALMSGVVLKMGVYGVIRVLFDLAGVRQAPIPPWWGVVVLAVGTASALLGVLYALMQHDLKRLLAYHSIENVGIIFMGIGAALLFLAYGGAEQARPLQMVLAGAQQAAPLQMQGPLQALAALALVAALFHTLNHACFKALLFLGAGAVVHATHTRNIEQMGGLIKRMPVTAFAFLVGSAAISALPPLNGFASEWLLFQSLLGGVRIPAPAVALLMPIAVGLLALTGGLAAACFVKAFGVTFLAIPRSAHAERASEAPSSMLGAMLLLVAACAGLGVGAFLIVPVLARIVSALPGLEAGAMLAGGTLFLPAMPAGLGRMSPAAIALGLAVLAVLVPILLRTLTPRLRRRREDTWGCGRLVQTPRMQYTATAFAEPLRRVFAELYRPAEDLNVEVHPESKYFIRGISYESEVRPWLERLVWTPSVAAIHRLGGIVRSFQAGSVHLYLAYLCAALIVLLLAARWLP